MDTQTQSDRRRRDTCLERGTTSTKGTQLVTFLGETQSSVHLKVSVPPPRRRRASSATTLFYIDVHL